MCGHRYSHILLSPVDMIMKSIGFIYSVLFECFMSMHKMN